MLNMRKLITMAVAAALMSLGALGAYAASGPSEPLGTGLLCTRMP